MGHVVIPALSSGGAQRQQLKQQGYIQNDPSSRGSDGEGVQSLPKQPRSVSSASNSSLAEAVNRSMFLIARTFQDVASNAADTEG